MAHKTALLLILATACAAAPRIGATPEPPRVVAPPAAAPAPTPAPVTVAKDPPPPPAPPARDTGPFWLDDGGAPVVVYPPKTPARPATVTVFLHGMCDVPENECPWIASAATDRGWLVCPRASLGCQGGGAVWSMVHAKETVESAVDRLSAARPGEVVAKTGGTLMGFSLGGTVAMSVGQAGQGRWSRLVVIAGKVAPDRRRLAAAGVHSVVFAAGDFDMTHGLLVGAARRLDRAGIPSTFLSLGKVGHTFPADMPDKMQAALGWLDGAS